MHEHEFNPYREKIAELAPLIAEHAEISDSQRHLHSSVARAMARAGLYRVALPRSIGGGEAHPLTQVKTIEAVSRIHGSTGWNLMIGIEVMGALGAQYDPALLTELFSDPELIIAGALNPLGKAVREGSGYRITGQWPFASGVHNAAYFWGQSIVHQDGERVKDDRGFVLCETLVPIDQVEIVDTWHVTGMRGSGSHDVRIDDVFVPDRFVSQVHRNKPLESGTLYRLPMYSRLAYNKIGVALGIARAAIDEFTTLATAKTPRGSSLPLSERHDAQLAIAEAEQILGSARSYAFEQIAGLWDSVEQKNKPTIKQKALLQLSCSGAVDQAVKAVDKVFSAAGASANFESSALSRCMRDILVVRQHIMVSPQHTKSVGRVLLGLDSESFLF